MFEPGYFESGVLDFDTYFKITKVRFLIRKDAVGSGQQPLMQMMREHNEKFGSYFPMYIELYEMHANNKINEKNFRCEIVPVNEDDTYLLYESNVIPPAFVYNKLGWKILVPNKCNKLEIVWTMVQGDEYFGYRQIYPKQNCLGENQASMIAGIQIMGCHCMIVPVDKPLN